ncbi:hypothetical protein PN473_13375, partial [Dolichospermum circinale CS-545/17]|nr:hypothetical protein [Dolichospermum circinale CS-545/17]
THGYIDPGLSMPVMLGVLPGAFLGARILMGAKTQILRIIFSVVFKFSKPLTFALLFYQIKF